MVQAVRAAAVVVEPADATRIEVSMAATEVSRWADKASGRVVVMVLDDMGFATPHSIYVMTLNGQTVDQAVAAILATVDKNTAALEAAFAAAGITA